MAVRPSLRLAAYTAPIMGATHDWRVKSSLASGKLHQQRDGSRADRRSLRHLECSHY